MSNVTFNIQDIPQRQINGVAIKFAVEVLGFS